MKKIEHCLICAAPDIPGYADISGKPVRFRKIDRGLLCSDCEAFSSGHTYFSPGYFASELEGFLSSNDRILFAYSGGLDSTAVLFLLNGICLERGIKLELFTVDTGFKGKMTMENITKVVGFLGLGRQHFWIDIRKAWQSGAAVTGSLGSPKTTVDVYRSCWQRNILPCGRICNSMMESAYRKVMDERGYSFLFTGGDTPKLNSDGKYSIFWQDGSIMTVRGGYAFNLSKNRNADLIREEGIPWHHPHCGGYDTDCLVPGSFFARDFQASPFTDPENLYKKHPIIFHYLVERTRFGIIDRKDCIKMMKRVDVGSLSSYLEFIEKAT